MLLADIVEGYIENPPAGLLLETEFVERCIKKAVRFYCGYQKLKAGTLPEGEIHDQIDAGNETAGPQNFYLTPSEYSIIRPLFELYVEHENAMMLEASRGLGVDVFGRTVSEIAQDITQREMDLPKQAFMEPAETI
jgi:hypothetical protein